MSPRFSRRALEVEEGVSPYLLPMRGSDHAAFGAMGFRWRDQVGSYRGVVLPDGFELREITSDTWEIADSAGYPRALVRRQGSVPSITPVRRFEPDVEQVVDGWKMLVREWSRISVRGDIYGSGKEANSAARAWLDQYKPGWDSYISKTNFRADPPKWNLFE